MAWWLWMIAGAVTAALAFITFVYVAYTVDVRRAAKRRAIWSQQSAAEQQMQQLVQRTIADMFNATRGYR